SPPAIATATYLTLSIGELAHSYNMRSPYKSLLEIGLLSNKYHVLGYLAGLALAITPIYITPWLLGATPLDMESLIYIILVSHIIIVIEEFRKRITKKIP
ncbi:MAG: hypothetical protein DRO40_02020, partial [Thermoprotei archaeon]